MLPAVELDDQMSICAEEVDNKSVDRKLSSEFPAGKSAITQAKPQRPLRMSLVATQVPCCFGAGLHRPNPLTPTLSPPGRGSSPRSFSAVLGPRSLSGRSPSKWQIA